MKSHEEVRVTDFLATLNAGTNVFLRISILRKVSNLDLKHYQFFNIISLVWGE
ncbi:MAG: hypothetical protein CM1200mP30_09170 [Pseudomonadota bacterium]|nr:MAG: hypothetical protein CM1200mP30_09170 [Pseudomonadota bacterium]